MTSKHDDRTRGGGLLLGAGAVLLMTICCALPVLIAGGMLTGKRSSQFSVPRIINSAPAIAAVTITMSATFPMNQLP